MLDYAGERDDLERLVSECFLPCNLCIATELANRVG